MDQIKEEEAVQKHSQPLMDFGVKLEPLWSMKEEPEDQPSTVDSTVQPISDNTSESLLFLNTSLLCQYCSTAFVLVSSLELHMASLHGEPLPFTESTELPVSSALQCNCSKNSDKVDMGHGRQSAGRVDQDRRGLGRMVVDFVIKQEPPSSTEDHGEPPDQPSAVDSTVQPMSDNTSGSLLSLNTSLLCQYCSAAFVLVSSLELHMASLHGEPLPFTGSTELPVSSALHGEELHVVLPVSPTPDSCSTGPSDPVSVEKDTGDCSGRKTVRRRRNKTDDCDETKKEKKNKSHVCDVCSKVFSLFSTLKRHKMIHTGDKPFICDVCNKAFNQSSNLKTHLRKHTVDRPYKCPHCDSCFNWANNLQNHIRSIHTSDRPYVCDVCGSAFSRISILQEHKRVHTGEKPYVCADCGKGFTRASGLKNHNLIHTEYLTCALTGFD